MVVGGNKYLHCDLLISFNNESMQRYLPPRVCKGQYTMIEYDCILPLFYITIAELPKKKLLGYRTGDATI